MLTSLTLSSGSLCSLALVVGKKRMSERKMLERFNSEAFTTVYGVPLTSENP